jgi:hypothetical protein
VLLHVRYQLFGDAVMIEETTTQTGNPVSRIVFHKVSSSHKVSSD